MIPGWSDNLSSIAEAETVGSLLSPHPYNRVGIWPPGCQLAVPAAGLRCKLMTWRSWGLGLRWGQGSCCVDQIPRTTVSAPLFTAAPNPSQETCLGCKLPCLVLGASSDSDVLTTPSWTGFGLSILRPQPIADFESSQEFFEVTHTLPLNSFCAYISCNWGLLFATKNPGWHHL